MVRGDLQSGAPPPGWESMTDVSGLIYTVSVWVIPVLLAITLHEAAHGWVAWRLGDDTAMRAGRVTINPSRHVDPVGTVLLPGLLLAVGAPFLFGYAKPVPVRFDRLNAPRRDMVWVALAGPAANLALAFVAALLLHIVAVLPAAAGAWLGHNLFNAIAINLVLAVFNMLPLPPLDGGRVAVGLLPDRLARPLARLERYGFLILIGLLFILPAVGDRFGFEFDLLRAILGPIIDALYRLLAVAAGHG